MRRGDNIPSVAEYAHWNEEAESMWYAENRYDMEHWDEEMGDEDDYESRFVDDPFEETFLTESAAREFMARYGLTHDCDGTRLDQWGDKWYVEHYNEKAHRSRRPH